VYNIYIFNFIVSLRHTLNVRVVNSFYFSKKHPVFCTIRADLFRVFNMATAEPIKNQEQPDDGGTEVVEVETA